MSNNQFQQRASMQDPNIMDWDTPIENDGNDFVFTVLPAGKYQFTVIDLSRETFPGGGKIPQCDKAVITLQIPYNGEQVRLKTDLILYRTVEWKISQFFRSIGMKAKGEKYVPQWNNTAGRTGWCKVTVRDYESKSGEKRQINDVTFIDPPLDSAVNYDTQSPYVAQAQAQASTQPVQQPMQQQNSQYVDPAAQAFGGGGLPF